MKVAVVDGQGGGIGKALIEKMRNELSADLEIIALGTNALATNLMLKAGANEGATGENAILVNCEKVDIIVGASGIIVSNSMLGELTPSIASAIAKSPAKKILIPFKRCNIEFVSVKNDSMAQHIENVVLQIKKYC